MQLNKKLIKDILIALCLTSLLAYFMRDLAIPGLPKTHDVNPHISRAIAYHTALLDGQFPPMWAKEVLGGIGSSVLMLNYQLPYMLGELWHRLGATIFDSYKISLGVTYIVSGLLMYFALRKRYGTTASWASAIIYSLAPYRFVDIYVRGALGESITFMFPPLLIWGFFTGSMPITILGWAGLFLTHPVASAAFSGFFLFYTLINGKGQVWQKLKTFFVPYFIALAIAMFNLLPTLSLTKYTYYSPSLSDTLLMFPTMGQLIHSDWGYGVSLPGPADGMSFEIGYVLIVTLLVGLVMAFKKGQKDLRFLTTASIIALLLILPVSMPLYKLFLGNIIDFPWRLLLCLVFSAAWTGAIIIDSLPSHKVQKVLVFLITIALVWQGMGMAHTHDYWPPEKDLAFFARETGDSYGEYAPRTRVTRDSAPFSKRAEFISGSGEIETLVDKSNEKTFLVKTSSAGEVRINTAYFPGWQMPDDCYVTQRLAKHIDDSGLMACFVQVGETKLSVRYVAPPVQTAGNLITLAGIGAYLWILFRSFYLHTTKKTQ